MMDPRHRRGLRRVHPEIDGVDDGLEGGGDDPRAAGALRRKGLSYEAILAALLVENESRCDPPLSDHEIETIARSISRYKPEDPVRGLEWSEMTQTILIDRMEGLTDYAKVYDAETLALLALA